MRISMPCKKQEHDHKQHIIDRAHLYAGPTHKSNTYNKTSIEMKAKVKRKTTGNSLTWLTYKCVSLTTFEETNQKKT